MHKLLGTRLFWPLAALGVAALSGSPAMALVTGAALALIWGNPRASWTGRLSRHLLQAAVVCLGFGLQLAVVLKVGFSSLGVTFVSIVGTLGLGYVLSRLFRVNGELATLLSSGTAICGGSAIAAIAPAIGASPANTAISLAVVFLLNALALLVFPVIGGFLDLGQEAFGLWSALAIHDTSSVVGATAIYGTQALAVGTTVKLTRALWILPLSFGCSRFTHKKSGATVPWFLGGFLVAAIIRTYVPGGETWWNHFADAGRFVMVASLFLIGSGLTRQALKKVGARPLFMAAALWLVVSAVSLTVIAGGWLKVDVPV